MSEPIRLATLQSQVVTRSNDETGFVEYPVEALEPEINLSGDPRGFILYRISLVLAHAAQETGMPVGMWNIYIAPRVQSLTNLPEKIDATM